MCPHLMCQSPPTQPAAAKQRPLVAVLEREDDLTSSPGGVLALTLRLRLHGAPLHAGGSNSVMSEGLKPPGYEGIPRRAEAPRLRLTNCRPLP